MQQNSAVIDLLPHNPPMVLLDELISASQESVHCQVTIAADCLYFNSKTRTVPNYIGIEFLAQSVGVWAGYHAQQKKETPKIGFLLGSRRYKASPVDFKEGQQLDIRANRVMHDENMSVFNGSITLDGQEVAKAQINLYQPTPTQLEKLKQGKQND